MASLETPSRSRADSRCRTRLTTLRLVSRSVLLLRDRGADPGSWRALSSGSPSRRDWSTDGWRAPGARLGLRRAARPRDRCASSSRSVSRRSHATGCVPSGCRRSSSRRSCSTFSIRACSRDEPCGASALGRWNGILYFVPLGIVVTREAAGLAVPGDSVVTAIAWVLVATTVLSIADRASTLIRLRRRRGNARDPAARPGDRELRGSESHDLRCVRRPRGARRSVPGARTGRGQRWIGRGHAGVTERRLRLHGPRCRPATRG